MNYPASSSLRTSQKWVRSMIHPSPVAIAIILGPLSSHPYNDPMMEQIGRIYYDYHPRYNCSVILASSPPLRFILNQNLQSVAQEVLHHTSLALIQQQQQQEQQQTTSLTPPRPPPPPQIPIILHSFSNGGAFLQEAIELELESINNTPTTTTLTRKEHYEHILSGLQMGYQFFDSCPCYIRTLWDTKYFFHSFPHEGLPKWIRTVYTFGSAFALSSWCILTLAWYRPQQFWNHMVHSTIIGTKHQIYMYTTKDLLTDAAAIDRLIYQRRHQYGMKCTVYRYNDSNHCQFYKDHPEEYEQAIHDALASVVSSPTTSTNKKK